jgi:hypothetical protein
VKTQGVGALSPYGLTSMRLAYLGRRSIGARTPISQIYPEARFKNDNQSHDEGDDDHRTEEHSVACNML